MNLFPSKRVREAEFEAKKVQKNINNNNAYKHSGNDNISLLYG